MNIIDIRTRLEHCWNINTTTSAQWSTNDRVRGQDLVTCLLVQAKLGGDILHANVTTPEGRSIPHFWNHIYPQGSEMGIDVDLTWHQFPCRSTVGETTPIYREAILSDMDIAHKYDILNNSFGYLQAQEINN